MIELIPKKGYKKSQIDTSKGREYIIFIVFCSVQADSDNAKSYGRVLLCL
jgi:hypothetical protein